ncbi:uncharacterized protein M421DRAFT_423911, partial [Didymella exigua CBS 183.55]
MSVFCSSRLAQGAIRATRQSSSPFVTRAPAIRLRKVQFLTHHRALSSTSTPQSKMPSTRQQDAPGNTPVQKSHRATAQNCTEHWEDEEHLEQNKKHFQEFRAQRSKSSSAGSASGSGGSDSDLHGDVPGGMKRGRGANQAGGQSKKAKSAETDPSGLPRGDKTRVPKVGQHVHWKYGKGYAKGEVVEVLYEKKEIEGKKAEASKEDPRLVLKANSSGKLAVHKPEDCYF